MHSLAVTGVMLAALEVAEKIMGQKFLSIYIWTSKFKNIAVIYLYLLIKVHTNTYNF